MFSWTSGSKAWMAIDILSKLRPVGVLSREQAIFSLPLQVFLLTFSACFTTCKAQASPRQKLQIVVENQGRVCFGSQLADRKGILGNVTLGTR